ncbi:MAG: DNA repair protein RecO [Verrucomicrobiales bacterium]|nr:DNA repair protein RecO [Verrucomicrobiales bacterium]
MDERATGVVLRVRLLTETSLVVHWLTEEHGRVATVARGARRPKSPLRGKLDLFHLGEFTFRRSRHSDLHQLGEVMLGETHPMLRRDWRRLTEASYGVAVVEQATESDTPLPELWPVFTGFLRAVNDQEPWAGRIAALELKVLEATGLIPDFERESLSAEARELALQLLAAPWAEVDGWRTGTEVPLGLLTRFLHGFLIYHLGRLPKGRAEALAAGTGNKG